MCGGFTCSKNALIALNILYVVSSRNTKIKLCISYIEKKMFSLYAATVIYFFFSHNLCTDDWFLADWRWGLCSGGLRSHKSANRWRNPRLRRYTHLHIYAGPCWRREASSSDALLRILFTNNKNYECVCECAGCMQCAPTTTKLKVNACRWDWHCSNSTTNPQQFKYMHTHECVCVYVRACMCVT